MALVGNQSSRDLPPEWLPSPAVEAKHDHFKAGVGILDSKNPFRLILRLRQVRINRAGIDGGGNEHLVSPDDGAASAIALDLGLPAEVSFLAPLDRRLRRGRDAVVLGTAPLVPAFRRSLGVASRGYQDRKSKEEKCGADLHGVVISPRRGGKFGRKTEKHDSSVRRSGHLLPVREDCPSIRRVTFPTTTLRKSSWEMELAHFRAA
jgi:hypothetical protein